MNIDSPNLPDHFLIAPLIALIIVVFPPSKLLAVVYLSEAPWKYHIFLIVSEALLR